MTATVSTPSTGAAPFEPRSPEYLADPYAYFRRLREQSPVFVDPGSGKWFLRNKEMNSS